MLICVVLYWIAPLYQSMLYTIAMHGTTWRSDRNQLRFLTCSISEISDLISYFLAVSIVT